MVIRVEQRLDTVPVLLTTSLVSDRLTDVSHALYEIYRSLQGTGPSTGPFPSTARSTVREEGEYRLTVFETGSDLGPVEGAETRIFGVGPVQAALDDVRLVGAKEGSLEITVELTSLATWLAAATNGGDLSVIAAWLTIGDFLWRYVVGVKRNGYRFKRLFVRHSDSAEVQVTEPPPNLDQKPLWIADTIEAVVGLDREGTAERITIEVEDDGTGGRRVLVDIARRPA